MGKLHQKRWTIAEYEQAADAYYHSLPLEHFMEAIPQSTQREITLESLAVLRARRTDVQVFNELLVQYFHEGQLRQVVPDNMVRLSQQRTASKGSFITEYEEAQPFLMIEYVSDNSKGKDYGATFRKYEQELHVPYCLMYHPDRNDLRVHRHTGEGYVLVTPNAQGRLEIPVLELEVAMLDGWVRYWHRGQLLALPAELLKQREEEHERAEQESRRAEQESRRAEQEKALRTAAESEVARLRVLLEQAAGGSRGRQGKRK